MPHFGQFLLVMSGVAWLVGNVQQADSHCTVSLTLPIPTGRATRRCWGEAGLNGEDNHAPVAIRHRRPVHSGTPAIRNITDRLMRSSKSRSRSKSNRQRSLGNVVNRVFDSSGPEGKVRGTPQQIIEKYLTLARDAQLSHDRVAEQSFLQHAEHYTRMLGEAQREMAERQGQPNGQNNRQDDDGGYSNHGYGTGHNASNHSNNNNNGGGGNNNGHQGSRNDQRGDQRSEQGDGGNGGQNQRRDNNRDQQNRQPRHDQTDQPAEAAPEPVQAPAPQQPSLPDAVAASDEDQSAAVTTPETEPAPKPARARSSRPRTPRSPTGTTTRSRRKPVAEDGAAPAAEAPAPKDSNDAE